MEINTVVCHHFGGIGTNNNASTKHLTEAHINEAHRQRWPDFPSKLCKSYIGYNFIIFPDGTLKQYRYIGEETAGAKGKNFDSIHCCMAGNMNKGVDTPTEAQVKCLQNLLKSLIRGDFTGLYVWQGTKVSITPERILSHRAVSPKGYTECYGSSLPDDWAMRLAMTSAPLPKDTKKKAILGILDEIILLIGKLRNLIEMDNILGLSHVNDRDDEGIDYSHTVPN